MPGNVPFLDGVTILEFGQVIAGTYAGALLADMGAEVIKIEPPTGDLARNPAIAGMRGESAIHLTLNRGKKSVVIDLKSDEGKEIFYGLVTSADAVLDNFRPGVLERLGVDHATLVQHNPQIVSTSVTGYGKTGPAKDRPAFDLVVQAASGHMGITGDPDRPPARMGIPMADLCGGLYACVSVLAGLVSRDRTGVGREVDISMMDCLVSLLGYDATLYLNTGKQLQRMGSGQAHMVPWQAFATADGYVAVAVREEKFFERFCKAIDRPELADDERSRTNIDRVANREWVVAQVQEALATRTTAEWAQVFADWDLPGAPVHDFEGVFDDPQTQARELVRSYEHPELGEVRYVTSPMKISDWEHPRIHAPLLGEHTAAILGERLGLDEARVADLAERGIVGVAA